MSVDNYYSLLGKTQTRVGSSSWSHLHDQDNEKSLAIIDGKINEIFVSQELLVNVSRWTRLWTGGRLVYVVENEKRRNE